MSGILAQASKACLGEKIINARIFVRERLAQARVSHPGENSKELGGSA